MTLEFEFNYRVDNDILGFLLEFYAKDYEYKIARNDEKYILQINGDEKNLNEFLQKLNLVPNSVFLRSFEVRDIDKFSIENTSFKAPKLDILTHINANAYLQEKILIENEFGEFLNLELSLDGVIFDRLNKDNFKLNLSKSLEKIKNNDKIYLKNHRGTYELSIFDNDFKNADFLLATNASSINSIFVCNNEKLKLLASLEKPIMSVKLSAILRQKLSLSFSEFKLKLSENLFTFALCDELFKENFKFVSVKKLENLVDDFELLSVDNEILVLRGFDFINEKARDLIFSKEDLNYARLSYIISKFSPNAFIMELSKDYDDVLLVNRSENLLSLNLAKNSTQLYEIIKSDEIGAKLLGNFANNFALLNEEFEPKNSFFSLFCILARVLNLHEDFTKAGESLLSLAEQSHLTRGVKIDFITTNLAFDYTRTVRSVMSFMLAGVPSENIAYGVLESLAFFLRDLRDELKSSDVAVACGSLFESKILLKNSLKHIKNCKLSDVPTRI